MDIDGGGKLWRGQHIESAEVGTLGLGRGGKSSGEGGTDGDVALCGGAALRELRGTLGGAACRGHLGILVRNGTLRSGVWWTEQCRFVCFVLKSANPPIADFLYRGRHFSIPKNGLEFPAFQPGGYAHGHIY